MLFEERWKEYRILQPTPLHIYQSLKKSGIPCMFFDFRESNRDFSEMADHIIRCCRSYQSKQVKMQAEVQLDKQGLTLFQNGNKAPFLQLERDPVTGLFRIKHSAYRPFRDEQAQEKVDPITIEPGVKPTATHSPNVPGTPVGAASESAEPEHP